MASNLPIPARLRDLIEAGWWPNDRQAAMAQNLRPLVSRERVLSFAPEEDEIHLNRPPFETVEQYMDGTPTILDGQPVKNDFFQKFGGLDQIDPSAALLIGDFGIGSDAPIILDYHDNPNDPCVRRLRWSDRGTANEWAICAASFGEFADLLGLGGRDS